MSDITFVSSSEVLGVNEPSLAEVLDKILDKGVVLRGEVWISVADVDLVFLGLDLLLSSPEKLNGRN